MIICNHLSFFLFSPFPLLWIFILLLFFLPGFYNYNLQLGRLEKHRHKNRTNFLTTEISNEILNLNEKEMEENEMESLMDQNNVFHWLQLIHRDESFAYQATKFLIFLASLLFFLTSLCIFKDARNLNCFIKEDYLGRSTIKRPASEMLKQRRFSFIETRIPLINLNQLKKKVILEIDNPILEKSSSQSIEAIKKLNKPGNNSPKIGKKKKKKYNPHTDFKFSPYSSTPPNYFSSFPIHSSNSHRSFPPSISFQTSTLSS